MTKSNSLIKNDNANLKILNFEPVYQGNRQILEKPIPQISENGKVCVIVEKNIRNWQICEIVETKMASPCYSQKN